VVRRTGNKGTRDQGNEGTGRQGGEAAVSRERRLGAGMGRLGSSVLRNWSKFVDDFEIVLLIPKALTSIFRLKNFYFFLI
jgi:hypothetical protein